MPLHQRNNIHFSDFAIEYMNDLVTTLYNQEYFGFIESASDYMFKMRKFIEQKIHILQHHTAPKYFSKYQSGMQYIAYPANKRTTWYVFFKQSGNRFLIYYITNNHYEGQFIR